jgi:hypothetical protein
MVVAVLLVVVGPAGPTTTNSNTQQTPVRNYHCSLRNNPEERSSRLCCSSVAAAGCPRYILFAFSICGEKEMSYLRFAPFVDVSLYSYYSSFTSLSLRYEPRHKTSLITPKPSSFTYQMDAPGADEKTSGHVKKILFLG